MLSDLTAFAIVGSSMSVRHFMRIGSSFSVNGAHMRIGKTGCTLSVMGSMSTSSSLSVRSFVRFGDACSVYERVALGSSLSVRSFARIELRGPGEKRALAARFLHEIQAPTRAVRPTARCVTGSGWTQG